MLQCDAVRCSALQCVAVCCSVLQCVAVCCSVLQCVAVSRRVLQGVAVWCSVSTCSKCSRALNFLKSWLIAVLTMSKDTTTHF